jgi:dihydrofolate reductase
MRKLKLQVQMSIDGFMSGINGEMNWMKFPWTPDINQYVEEITGPVDTIVLGRKLAEGFIPHWSNIASDPENAEYQAGKKYSDTPKIVFTRTLDKSPWDNTVLAKGNLTDEIRRLKEKKGSDIIAYGGSELVSSLIKENLIDELHLFINPAAIGKGLPVFHQLNKTARYNLKMSKLFDCGIIVLQYRPV